MTIAELHGKLSPYRASGFIEVERTISPRMDTSNFISARLGFWEMLLVFMILCVVFGTSFLSPVLKRVLPPLKRRFDTAGALMGDAESERRLGAACADEFAQQYPPDNDPSITQRISSVLSDLSGKAEGPSQFHCQVMTAPFANAFAAPGGHIFLTRQAIDLCGKSQSQLAFLLGHEMAHIRNRDWESQLAIGWAVSILTQGRLSGLAKQLTNQLVSKGYSREAELEADRSAVEALQRAGFDPSIGIQVLSKLAGGKEDLSPVGEYFSTHPSTDERLRLLRRHVKRLDC